jgi:hypothetical protein
MSSPSLLAPVNIATPHTGPARSTEEQWPLASVRHHSAGRVSRVLVTGSRVRLSESVGLVSHDSLQ